jgi:phosphomannomutase
MKVYDARWQEGEFSRAEIRRLIEATLIYGRLLNVDTVTICRDARIGSSALMEQALEVAVDAGLATYVCTEPISTPHSYFVSSHTTLKHPNTLGLTVTASHNPAEYLGLKIVVPPVQAIGLDCGPLGGFRKIREIYHGNEKLGPSSRGRFQVLDLTKEYVDFSFRAAGVEEGSLEGIEVVFDFFNGCAGSEMMQALQRTGATVKPLRLVPDGRFPTGSPNPTSVGKMEPAVSRARTMAGAVAIGTDGDGDRLVFGDAGGILSAGIASLPILQCVFARGAPGDPARVLHDPKVNPIALAQWARLGLEPILFRNGHSQVKEQMRRLDASAGVEESGHYYHRLLHERKAIYVENSLVTILLFLRSVKERPSLLPDLWIMQKKVFTSGEFNYQMDNDRIRDAAMAKALESLRAEGAALVSRTAEGVDLMGTVFSRGIDLDSGRLQAGWYQGYLRNATNERAVVRSYLSADAEGGGRQKEQELRVIYESYGGRVID